MGSPEESWGETSGALSAGLTSTPARGWAVLLLFQLRGSSIILASFTFGIFLPFITKDLHLSPLEAGLLQAVWWITSALLALPFGTWFSRFRPVPLVLVSLLLGIPFLFLQGLAVNFFVLLMARFFFVLFHVITTPARTLLLQEWVAPRHYALVNAVGLSQHSTLLAVAISTSALLIAVVGSWRLAYFILGGFLMVQMVAWVLVAREERAPVSGLRRALRTQVGTPLRAIRAYPQGWLIGVTMFSWSATWTAMVTFLPTFLLEERELSLKLGGPLLAFLYYVLIPSAPVAAFLERRVRSRKLFLWVPSLFNMIFGVAIAVTPNPFLLMALITGLGMVWIASPVVQVLPFEFPGIRPREVAVVAALVGTFSGLGFAAGPLITGLVAQLTGSIQTGLIVLSLITGIGVIAGLLYPSQSRGVKPPVEVPV
ncbi:MAG: hypothetical protein BZY88_14265 [SAR202 cluster bacterium Io17-Chloro-G9]|nr:MAG: hypothetical protein BZY88_14265 [SAR202 cluster bacterium Io17-Chloro-G9]